ncbi:MAG: Hsp20/alpha crystallin family protein [Halobacteriaceae archaeon]
MVRSSRFDEFDRVFDQMDRLFDQWRASMSEAGERGRGASVDVHRDDDEYVVLADLPGFEKEELELTAEGNVLRIDAEHEVGDDGVARTRRVHESVSLPEDVDVDAVSATYRNGVLEVRMPVAATDSAGHRIDID